MGNSPDDFKQRKIFKKYVLPEGSDRSITEAINNKKNGLAYSKTDRDLNKRLLTDIDIDYRDILGTQDLIFEENKETSIDQFNEGLKQIHDGSVKLQEMIKN